MKQAKTIGILYLENRLSEAVFTAEKTRMTELLTSWAALSLENARLCDELRKSQERASGFLELLKGKQVFGSTQEPSA